MNRLACVMLMSAALLLAAAADVSAQGTLIAHYTLDLTVADETGNHADAFLVNAPYEDGGIYLNGLYPGTEPDGSLMQTALLTDLQIGSCSLSIEFKVGELPGANMPILMCGPSWRWMGAGLTPTGEVFLYCNSADGPAGGPPVSLDTWHVLALAYDGTTGRLILDGVEVASRDFTANHHDDKWLSTENGANATAFKGHLRDLRVYNGFEESLPAEQVTIGELKARFR